jgi:hypothetical protein
MGGLPTAARAELAIDEVFGRWEICGVMRELSFPRFT